MIRALAMLRALALGLIFFAGMAQAQALRGDIQSGGHDSFDRLVITLDSRPDWRIEQGPNPLVVFDADNLDLDLSRVFSRIDRSRLQDIDIDADTLTLSLGCDCEIRAFDLGPQRIVIDIVDKSPELATVPESIEPVGTTTFSPLPRSYLPTALGLLSSPDDPAVLEWSFSDPPRPVAPRPPSFVPQDRDTPSASARPSRTQADLEQSALSRSVLDIELLSEALATASSRGITDAPALADDIDNIVSPDSVEPRPGMSIRSIFDVGASDTRQVATADATCQPRALHDLAAWTNEKPVSLGEARADLLDGKDRLRPEEIHRLTRFYLTRAFGAEARRLQFFLPPGKRVEPYLAIADILDYGQTGSTAFSNQILCPGGAALWAAFSADLPPEALSAGNPAILRTFSNLPAAVRLQLGQELSERLRNAGRRDDAEVVTNAVARTGSRGRGDHRHAASRLGLGGRDTEIAIAELEAMIASTDANAGRALVALFEHASATRMPARSLWLDHAEPLIRANRGSPTSSRLRLLWLEALIDSGAFAEARDAWFLHREALTDDERARVGSHLVSAGIERADDPQVLEIVTLMAAAGDLDGLPEDERTRLSTRLMAGGVITDGVELGLAEPKSRPMKGPSLPGGPAADDETPDPIAAPRALRNAVKSRMTELADRIASIEF